MPKLNIDLEKLISKSVKNSVNEIVSKFDTASDSLNEGYVVQQQVFKQPSENVSQKTKDAHNNLYKGYVETLNRIAAELDSVDKDQASNTHSELRDLKIDETYNHNGVVLHELYFSNCFDPNSEIYMDSLAYMRLQRDFGTFDDWQKDFLSCGLSAREGWVVTGYNFYLKRYVNAVIDSHDKGIPIGFHPVIVMDMWSHAYYRDYLDDKKSYLVALMKELNWDVIEKRFKAADEMAKILK